MTDSVDAILCSRIRFFRQRRNLTIRALADRCAELGAPELTAAALTNIERMPGSGRRPKRIAVHEWIVLAYALRVPPLALLIPLGTDEPYAITDTIALHPLLALEALADNGPLPDSEGRIVGSPGDWNLGMTQIDLYLEFVRTRDSLDAAWADLQNSDKREYLNRMGQVVVAFAKNVNALLDADLPVPHPALVWFYRLHDDQRWVSLLHDSLNRAGVQWATDHLDRREVGDEG